MDATETDSMIKEHKSYALKIPDYGTVDNPLLWKAFISVYPWKFMSFGLQKLFKILII